MRARAAPEAAAFAAVLAIAVQTDVLGDAVARVRRLDPGGCKTLGMAEPIDPGADVGHVHLRVADLDRSVAFYRDVLGFEVQQAGRSAAFLSAGGYHHHVALNTWESLGGSPPPPARRVSSTSRSAIPAVPRSRRR